MSVTARQVPVPTRIGRRHAVLAAGTGFVLLGVVSAPAAHAAGVDETELARLRADIAATSAAWTADGGTDATRCTISFDGASASTTSTVRFDGGHGAVQVAYRSGSRLTTVDTSGAQLTSSLTAHAGAGGAVLAAAARGRTQVYLTPTSAVLPLPGRLRTALGRHGLHTERTWREQPYATSTNPSLSRAAYLQGTTLDGSLLDVVTVGRVVALTSTTDGSSTTYRGTATDPSVSGDVDPLDFVVVVADGAVTRAVVTVPAEDDEIGMSCRSRLSLGGTTVRVPRALSREPAVVSAEASLLALSQQIAKAATLVPRDQRARVRMVQALAWSLTPRHGAPGRRVAVAEVGNGVVLTRTVRGWQHPLRWHVSVSHGQVHAYPVVTAPQDRHR